MSAYINNIEVNYKWSCMWNLIHRQVNNDVPETNSSVLLYAKGSFLYLYIEKNLKDSKFIMCHQCRVSGCML